MPSRIDIETLEDRALFSTCSSCTEAAGLAPAAMTQESFVYTESNNPTANAVLAYQRDATTGALAQLTGADGFAATGGRGLQAGLSTRFGPDDSDSEVVATPDGKTLFAVNQGSDTVSEFSIAGNGSLKLLSQFASGGVQPVSLQFGQNHLYVLNRGDSTNAQAASAQPALSVFSVSTSGVVLEQGASVAVDAGNSPSQILLSSRDHLLFIDNFATFSQHAPHADTLQAFAVSRTGSLSSPGRAAGVDGRPLQGLALNPRAKLLYAGLPRGGVVVFSYSSRNALRAGKSVSGGAGTCWAVVSADGKFLYVANTLANTVGVYSLANPRNPVRAQDFSLRGPGVAGPGSGGGVYQLALDPSGHNLYAVNHGFGETFQPDDHLHTLVIASNGTVTEPRTPTLFSSDQVTAQSRPQGLAIVAR